MDFKVAPKKIGGSVFAEHATSRRGTMPYTITINAIIDGENHDADEALELVQRLQSALDNLHDAHGFDVVEYAVEAEDEALGIKVVGTESGAAG